MKKSLITLVVIAAVILSVSISAYGGGGHKI